VASVACAKPDLLAQTRTKMKIEARRANPKRERGTLR
jgi:hypothetical protein